jgi:hypothetical protein
LLQIRHLKTVSGAITKWTGVPAGALAPTFWPAITLPLKRQRMEGCAGVVPDDQPALMLPKG